LLLHVALGHSADRGGGTEMGERNSTSSEIAEANERGRSSPQHHSACTLLQDVNSKTA
jgi:hypothetical protein